MSMPRGTEDLTIDTIELGVPLGRAWIRLFGLLPIDYDHLSIVGARTGSVVPREVDHAEHAVLAARADADAGDGRV